MRDQATNKNITHKDDKLREIQKEKRLQSHNKVPPVTVHFDEGDTVMIKDQLTKLKPREKFVVVDPNPSDNHVKLQKQDKKFNARQYEVPKHQLLRVPRQAALKAKKSISEWTSLYKVDTDCTDHLPLHAWQDCDDDEPVITVIKPIPVLVNEDSDNTSESDDSTTDHASQENDSEHEMTPVEDVDYDQNDHEEAFETPDNSPEPMTSVSRVLRPDSVSDVQLNQVQRLDHILSDNRHFLAQHPHPPPHNNPAYKQRSGRISRPPRRYRDE